MARSVGFRVSAALLFLGGSAIAIGASCRGGSAPRTPSATVGGEHASVADASTSTAPITGADAAVAAPDASSDPLLVPTRYLPATKSGPIFRPAPQSSGANR